MGTDKEPPSPYTALLLERRQDIVRISLNRPEKLNALSVRLQSELSDALSAIAADSSVRVLIVSAEGRAFCAGLDLDEFPESLTHFQNLSQNRSQNRPQNQNVFRQLDELSLPVIAAINGLAVTGGFELALSCDLLIASTTARFADTHGRIGIMPGAGLSQKLSRIIGLPRAMAVSLSGEFLEAEAAYACGLVSHLVEPEALMPLAWRLAEQIAAGEPAVIREMKRVIKEGAGTTLAGGMEMEREAHDRWARNTDIGEVVSRKNQLFHRNRATPPDP
ncbi:MAG: enoyl-CoA hydratase [bacterium]